MPKYASNTEICNTRAYIIIITNLFKVRFVCAVFRIEFLVDLVDLNALCDKVLVAFKKRFQIVLKRNTIYNLNQNLTVDSSVHRQPHRCVIVPIASPLLPVG